MTFRLVNPRNHVQSASIHVGGDGKTFLSYTSIHGGNKSDFAADVTAAKSMFSRCVLSPRYHGPNIWKKVEHEKA